jgi:hypothetical protein
MFWLILVGVPVAALLAAGVGLHFLDSTWVVRVSNAAIGLQVAAALVVFTLPKTMPTKLKYETGTCPDLGSGQGDFMTAVTFGSIVTGAVALASSFIAVRRRVARPSRLLAGIAAAVLTPAIFLRLVVVALCGYYD